MGVSPPPITVVARSIQACPEPGARLSSCSATRRRPTRYGTSSQFRPTARIVASRSAALTAVSSTSLFVAPAARPETRRAAARRTHVDRRTLWSAPPPPLLTETAVGGRAPFSRLLRGLKRYEVLQHVRAVRHRVHLHVDLPDDSRRVDQERVPGGVRLAFVHRDRPVGLRDLTRGVGEELEIQAFLRAEALVR